MALLISKAKSDRLAAKLPLTRAEMTSILSSTLRHLKGSPEYERIRDVLGVPRDLEIHFCDDEEMREYQRRFRRLDRTTDVLSFPAVESPEQHEKHFLGSLIVSLPTVERNARRYSKTLREELVEIYVHGILHLFGFDHVRVGPRKRQRMLKFQKDICQKLSL